MVSKRSIARRFEGVRFLYVDDETENLNTFDFNYADEFDFKLTTDPREALEIFRADPDIGVLIVDQVMTGLTGLELAVEAHKLRPATVCLMITGNASKELAIESIRARIFWEFLEKPVDFSNGEVRHLLVNALQEHLLRRVRIEYREGTILLLSRLIDDKDGHTQRHSDRVQRWAVKIAERFGLSERDMVIIREGALLHDLGKISIPDDILKKPGRLTELERRIMMTHPLRGAQLLESVPQLRELAAVARDHHERPDGKGYPRGLKGDEIPLTAQIIAISDFFEALSAKRPYKDPWEASDIVVEILRVRGLQFSEEVVDAMLEILMEENVVTSQQLDDLKSRAAA